MGNVRFQLVTVNQEDELVLQQTIGAGLKEAIAKAIQSGALKRFQEGRERKKRGG